MAEELTKYNYRNTLKQLGDIIQHTDNNPKIKSTKYIKNAVRGVGTTKKGNAILKPITVTHILTPEEKTKIATNKEAKRLAEMPWNQKDVFLGGEVGDNSAAVAMQDLVTQREIEKARQERWLGQHNADLANYTGSLLRFLPGGSAGLYVGNKLGTRNSFDNSLAESVSGIEAAASALWPFTGANNAFLRKASNVANTTLMGTIGYDAAKDMNTNGLNWGNVAQLGLSTLGLGISIPNNIRNYSTGPMSYLSYDLEDSGSKFINNLNLKDTFDKVKEKIPYLAPKKLLSDAKEIHTHLLYPLRRDFHPLSNIRVSDFPSYNNYFSNSPNNKISIKWHPFSKQSLGTHHSNGDITIYPTRNIFNSKNQRWLNFKPRTKSDMLGTILHEMGHDDLPVVYKDIVNYDPFMKSMNIDIKNTSDNILKNYLNKYNNADYSMLNEAYADLQKIRGNVYQDFHPKTLTEFRKIVDGIDDKTLVTKYFNQNNRYSKARFNEFNKLNDVQKKEFIDNLRKTIKYAPAIGGVIMGNILTQKKQ